MPRRTYSDEDKATALAYYDATGGRLRKAARDLDIPFTTLQEWVRMQPCTEVRTVKKRDLAARLEELAAELIDLAPDKFEDASLRDVSVAIGIAVEKMQLLRGEPTAISEQVMKEHAAIEAYKQIKAEKGETVTDAQARAAIAPVVQELGDTIQ